MPGSNVQTTYFASSKPSCSHVGGKRLCQIVHFWGDVVAVQQAIDRGADHETVRRAGDAGKGNSPEDRRGEARRNSGAGITKQEDRKLCQKPPQAPGVGGGQRHEIGDAADLRQQRQDEGDQEVKGKTEHGKALRTLSFP